MSLASTLTVTAVFLFVLASGLLVWLAVTQPGFSFHGIWNRALAGHKPSRIYMVLVIVAFALAVAAQALRITESKVSRSHATISSKFFRLSWQLSLHPESGRNWNLRCCNLPIRAAI